MKNLIVGSLMVAAFIAPFTTSAELLVYKGVLAEQFFGANGQAHRNWKILVIVDHSSGYFSRVGYGTVNGVKRYFSSQYTNSHLVEVTGFGVKTGSAITRIPTDCEAQDNPGGESVYFKGFNATLTVNAGVTTSFPRTLNHSGGGLWHTSSSNLPYLEDYSYTLLFNPAQTVAWNRAGQTLDTALANFVALVQSQGYSE